MIHIETIPDPILNLDPPVGSRSPTYPIIELLPLETAEGLELPLFTSVLDSRISTRKMGIASVVDLGRILWLGNRVRSWIDANPGPIQSRPAPASGGLHALDLLVSRLTSPTDLYLYDPFLHSLGKLELDHVQHKELKAYHSKVDELFPVGKGCVITLLVDAQKLSSKYLNWESLALRDAGALLATLQLCSASLDLPFCFAGILGNEIASLKATGSGSRIGAGVAVFGSTISLTPS